MKLNEIKCESCDKNNKFKCKNTANNIENDEESLCNKYSHEKDYEPVYESNEYGINQQQVVARCIDCNHYLCSNCLLDHQLNASFGNHQLTPLATELIKDSKTSSETKKSSNSTSASAGQSFSQISNLAQLQLQYNNLEDQVLIKRRQQQQQQQAQQQILINNHHQQQHQQMLQQNKMIQIENEIQKSYNFYIQMLKERRDYLINELNTIVQYALLSHTQNYNKQLKLKTELEQKRQSLEIAEAVASALQNTATQNESSLNDSLNGGYGKLRDSNNNKISAGLAEIGSLQIINNQVLHQLKQSNPLNSIEFVSNYSAIQTSIRNTFGYIRIRDTNTTKEINGQQMPTTSVSDYLAALNKKQTHYQQNELKILTDFESNGQMTTAFPSSSGSVINSQAFYNPSRMFPNTNAANAINTLSCSSTDSSKSSTSSSSIVSSMSSTSSLSSSVGVSGSSQSVKEQQQQNSFSDYNYSSPVSNQNNSSNVNSYLTDQLSSGFNHRATSRVDWPINNSSNYNHQPSNSTSLGQLISNSHSMKPSSCSSSKQINENELNNLLMTDHKQQKTQNENSEYLLNSNKFSLNNSHRDNWPSTLVSGLVETENSEKQRVADEEDLNQKSDVESFIYSAFLNSVLEQQQQNQLQQDMSLVSPFSDLKDQSKLNISKLNSSAITLSASSTKSNVSSMFNKLTAQQSIHDENLMFSANQQLLTSPEDRLSTTSSPASDINYQDSNIDKLSSDLAMKNMIVGSSSISSSASSSSSSSSRSQLRRSKMIYHCKFGEFGITDGQFTEPSGVTINTNNDIIVADTNSHRIQIFDKDGRFKFKFGECGKRDGQLLYPNRVSVVKQTGDIVVTERSPTHQIQIYNKYGQFLRKFGANILQHPRGVCVDSKGRIIVVECKVMRVLIFDLMGNVLQKFNCSKYLEFPNGVCCSNTNDREEIYISDNRAHCIKVFDYNGNFVRQIGGEGITNYPIGVGINSNNEILVADNHNNFNLTVFTQDGQLINALESKVKHAQCFDVGLMDDGSIVLASKDYRIYVYKYLNSSYNLSSSICAADAQLLSGTNENELISNEANMVSTINNSNTNINENNNLYDLFSPSLSEFSNYSQLVGHLTSIANLNFNTSFTKSKSSDNLIDSFNSINCLNI